MENERDDSTTPEELNPEEGSAPEVDLNRLFPNRGEDLNSLFPEGRLRELLAGVKKTRKANDRFLDRLGERLGAPHTGREG